MYRNGAGLRTAVSMAVVTLLALGLAGCSTTPKSKSKPVGSHINTKTKFSVSEYGVAASPRMTTAKRPKKGGGRAFVGKPYRVRGKWYTPKEEPDYDKAGLASWYGPNFHGRLTANGEIYDQFHLSAAHPTFPLPSYARVTNKKNGNTVIVRVNDRGPFAHGRIIDLSNQAAELLDMKQEGVAAVRVEYVGRAPVEGDDTRYLMASYRPGGSSAPAEGVIATGVDDGNEYRRCSASRRQFRPRRDGPAGGPGFRNRDRISGGRSKRSVKFAAGYANRFCASRCRAGASRPAILRVAGCSQRGNRHARCRHGILGGQGDPFPAAIRHLAGCGLAATLKSAAGPHVSVTFSV